MEPAEFSAATARTARRFCMDLSRPLAMISGGLDSVALLRVLAELGALDRHQKEDDRCHTRDNE